LSYGDFQEEDDLNSNPERIFFFVATIGMPLVLLNLLVAIMGDTYARVSEEQAIADEKELLGFILELAKFSQYVKRESVYMHIH
jgi:hypothetical protein